jgi:hypothetical protein
MCVSGVTTVARWCFPSLDPSRSLDVPDAAAHGRPVFDIRKDEAMHLAIREEAEEDGVVDHGSIACGEAGEIDRRGSRLGALIAALNSALKAALIQGCPERRPDRIPITRIVIGWWLIIYVSGVLVAVVGSGLEHV